MSFEELVRGLYVSLMGIIVVIWTLPLYGRIIKSNELPIADSPNLVNSPVTAYQHLAGLI
jgi:hypothetical protein